MNSIGFLETMLQYYLPGLDVSSLDDEMFIMKSAYLLRIRAMEANDKVGEVFKQLFGK